MSTMPKKQKQEKTSIEKAQEKQGLTKTQMQDILDNFGEYEEDSRNKTKEVREDEEARRKKLKGK